MKNNYGKVIGGTNVGYWNAYNTQTQSPYQMLFSLTTNGATRRYSSSSSYYSANQCRSGSSYGPNVCVVPT